MTISQNQSFVTTSTNQAPYGSLDIRGFAYRGATLTVSNHVDDYDGTSDFSYQWRADGVAIEGATDLTFVLTDAQYGKRISVTASYIDGIGNEESMTSAATVPIPTAASGKAVELAYIALVGRPAEPDDLARWSVLADKDAGALDALRSAIVASREFTNAIAGLSQEQVVDKLSQNLYGHAADPATRTLLAQALASGTKTVGGVAATLSSSAEGADASVLDNKVEAGEAFTLAVVASNEVRWYENTATHAVGARYMAGVTSDTSLTSAISGIRQTMLDLKKLPANSLPTYITLDGDTNPIVGETLTVNTESLYDANGLGTLHYRWLANGTAIAGATGTSLVLTDAQVGKYLTVEVSYVDGKGAEETATTALLGSVWLSSTDEAIQRAFIASHGRAASRAELASASAPTTEPIYTSILAYHLDKTDEFKARFAGLSSEQVVDKIYTTIYGKSAPASEVLYHAPRLNDGREEIAHAILRLTPLDGDPGSSVLRNKAYAAEALAAALDTPVEQAAYARAATNQLVTGYLDSVVDAQTRDAAIAGLDATVSAIVNLAPNHLATGAVTISGAKSAVAGTTLSAANTIADVDGLEAVSYQWLANGVNIVGATGATFVVGQRQAGADISAMAIYTDGKGYRETVTSTAILSGNDRLAGTSGGDRLAGGTGDDVYVINHLDDIIIEESGEGIDSVEVSVAPSKIYTMTATVENATLAHGATAPSTLTGNAMNNVLVGNELANALYGNAGNDTLDGGAGADKLFGGADNDTYIVDNAGDVVAESAGAGTDVVRTALNSYTMSANVENLEFTGNAAHAGFGNALGNNIAGSAADDTLDGLAGDDRLSGNAGNDTLKGGLGKDILSGGDGDDLLDAGTGSDVTDGGAGSDTLQVLGNFADYVRSRPTLADTVLVNTKTGESVTLRNVEQVRFADGLKSLALVWDNVASPGNDKLRGTTGNDVLDGGLGSDTLTGGKGNDTYVLDNAGDVVAELTREGTDLVKLAFAQAGTYRLTANVENATVTAGASVAVDVTGNELDNALVGNGAANTLQGGAGNDTLSGGDGADLLDAGAGNDTVDGGTGADTLQVLGNFGDYTRARPTLTDTVLVNTKTGESITLRNIEHVRFADGKKSLAQVWDNVPSPGNDKLTGTAGSDVLDGGAGSDTLTGGMGNDTYVLDNTSDTVVELAGEGTDVVKLGFAQSASYQLAANVENATVTAAATVVVNVTGNALANALTGNDAANTLRGGAGDDTLSGGAGDDRLDAGTGSDVADGGAGNDTLQVLGNFADYVRSRPTLTDTVLVNANTGESITLRNVEQVRFADGTKSLAQLWDNLPSPGNDKLRGTAGNDVLDGGLGSDTMTGGMGNDTYVLDRAGDVVVELAGEGTDLVKLGFTQAGNYQLAANVENALVTAGVTVAVDVTGNALANSLTGNGAANTLKGGAGNDRLNGAAGDDRLDAGTGIDLAEGGAGSDTLQVLGNFADYVRSRPTLTDTVLANAKTGEKITLRNVEQVHFADGTKSLAQVWNNVPSTGDDMLTGTAGNDILDGGRGIDNFTGGKGNDTYLLDNVAELVVELAGEGTDTVKLAFTQDSGYGLDDNVENATVTAAATVVVSVSGNELANIIIGNGAANRLRGYAGNDVLDGGLGNDTLDGGTGIDTLKGGAGDDAYVVDQVKDVVVELAAAGTDRVVVDFGVAGTYQLTANVENAGVASAASVAINLTGNSLDNELIGNGKTNILQGGDGNDRLDGRAGADTLAGGAGDDRYVVDNAGDKVVELAGEGIDIADVTFTTLGTYLLSANVEKAYVSSAAGMVGNLTGNALDNTLWGNATANVLSGGDGNDWLIGGAGSDTLSGGAGKDNFYFDSTVGRDRVLDFQSGTDWLGIVQNHIVVGDGDKFVENAVLSGAGNRFSSHAEVVVFTAKIGGAITAASAAAAIGSADNAYVRDATALFAVNNGTDSVLYLFKANAADAAVSASELTEIATLVGTPALTLRDIGFAIETS